MRNREIIHPNIEIKENINIFTNESATIKSYKKVISQTRERNGKVGIRQYAPLYIFFMNIETQLKWFDILDCQFDL